MRDHDRVIQLPTTPPKKRWRLPDRDEMADIMERTSKIFANMAFVADVVSRSLRMVSRELTEPRRRNRL